MKTTFKGLFIKVRSIGLARFPRSRLPLFYSYKSWCVHIRSRDQDLGETRWKFSRMNTPAQVTKMQISEFWDKIALFSQHCGEICISTWGVCELALLVKFLAVHKATGYSREWYKLMFHHLGCVSLIASQSTIMKFPISTNSTENSSR